MLSAGKGEVLGAPSAPTLTLLSVELSLRTIFAFWLFGSVKGRPLLRVIV